MSASSFFSLNPFAPPTVFPFEEFVGLVYRVLEVLETDPNNNGGLAVLHCVRPRVVESGNFDLLERLDRALADTVSTHVETANQPKTLRQLVNFISDSTDPGSVYVLRRTDRLGDRDMQEELIRKNVSVKRLWFAPERFGQRSPAMAFVQVNEEISEGVFEFPGTAFSVTVSRFIYQDR